MSIYGKWVSRGYGWILEIGVNGYALFDHTRLACIEFERGDSSQFEAAFDRINLQGDDLLSLHVRGDISRYDFDRSNDTLIGKKRVDTAQAHDALTIFDVFCEYFRQDYVFFELRNVDWERCCKRARELVSPNMKSEDLFSLLAGLIEELQDNHVVLRDGEKLVASEAIANLKAMMVRQFKLKSPSIGDPETIAKIQPFVCREFLNGNSRSAGNGAINWGLIEPGIGYLNILKLFGLADTEEARTAIDLPPHRYDHARLLQDDFAALEDILDRAMTDLGDSDAIILDIRINGGGFDRLGMSIANRFCDRQQLAFTKEARDGNGYTAVQEFFLNPGRQPAFTKPVYVLTSARTSSAGEVMALSLRALPNTTLVGEPTIGILSDNLSKRLPNGWTTTLSNEIYRAVDGAIFEKTGVPVDVKVPVFEAIDFAGGMQRAIETSKDLAQAINS